MEIMVVQLGCGRDGGERESETRPEKFQRDQTGKVPENVFVPLTVGGGIRDFTDANGRHYTSLEVASEYFRSGADKISIGSDAVYSAEEYLRIGVKTGKSSLEQISRVYGNQVQMEKSMPGISALLMVGEKVDQLELMSLQKQMKSWELEKYY